MHMSGSKKWWKRKASAASRAPKSLSSEQLNRALGYTGMESPGAAAAWLPHSSGGGHDGGGHGRLSAAAGQALLHESDPMHPTPHPFWAAHRRALRRAALRTCSRRPPLEQPALLARILA